MNLYQAQGEFEQSLNSIGQRQSELIKKNIRMQEWYLFYRNGQGSTSKLELSMSHPNSRSDPNGGSEPSSGRETIYWDSLPALSDVGVSKS